jgi:hypothetical protein
MKYIKISYETLLEKSKFVKSSLLNKKIIDSSVTGRYCVYENLITQLNEARHNGQLSEFLLKYKKGEVGFALKELRELVDVFEQILVIHNDLSIDSRKNLMKKIKIILGGPNFTENETKDNNSPRNHQFELRLAAKFIQSGLTNIEFKDNPDILIDIDNKQYGCECKRIFSLSERSLIRNTIKAIRQIKTNKDNYYAGIVALDVSPQFEQGKNWLTCNSRNEADTIVLDQLEKYVKYMYNKINKIQSAAKDGYVVAIILNSSTVYLLKDFSDIGWIQETGVLVLDKENKIKAESFLKDFNKLQEYADS